MIKFFRHIRQNLLKENETGKYLKYAIGEIVLVVIGILIALSINNWNENRKNAIEETKILQELKNSISTDIKQLNLRLEWGKRDIHYATSLLNHVEKKLTYNDSLNKQFVIISMAGIEKMFSPQISIYKVLESKGIDLISSDKLKKQVLDLYNIEYPKLDYEYENYRINIHDYGRPIARTQFTIENYEDPVMKPADYNSISSSIEFINTVKVIRVNSFAINGILEGLIKKCQEIENIIDNELEK